MKLFKRISVLAFLVLYGIITLHNAIPHDHHNEHTHDHHEDHHHHHESDKEENDDHGFLAVIFGFHVESDHVDLDFVVINNDVGSSLPSSNNEFTHSSEFVEEQLKIPDKTDTPISILSPSVSLRAPPSIS